MDSNRAEAWVPGRGFFDGEWFTEESRGGRQGYRIRELLHEERTPFQKISVYDSEFFGYLLALDDLVMLTERDEFVYHEMIVHVPLLALSDPRSVLIIGGGDCGCVREAMKHPLDRIVQCEIDERVTRVCDRYFPWVAESREDPRVELVFEDGVGYVDRHDAEFDLIVIDSTDPLGPAVGLFQEEFYAKVRGALRPGGVMVAQTESPHWDPSLVGRIHAEIGRVFAETHAYLGAIPSYPSGLWTWGLASSDDLAPVDFDPARAATVAETCLYYTPEVHRAAFQLPGFVARALAGDDPFSRFRRSSR